MSEFIKHVELIDEFDSYEEFKESEYSNYSKFPSISVSKLKKLKKSPLHYKEEERKDTEAFTFGSAYHCYLLEPEKFKDRYYVIDEKEIIDILVGEGAEKPRATKTYKEWLDSQTAKAEGKIILNSDDFQKIKDMGSRILSHHYAKSLIRGGIAERFLFVKLYDNYGNEYYIKLIADYFKENKRIITDLKSCNDAIMNGFQKDAAKYDYHLQSALYSDIYEHLYFKGFKCNFFFLAQEKAKPYAFNIFEASPQFLGQGRYEYEMLLMLWKQCENEGVYPGYQVWCENKYGVNEISLPPWAISEVNYYKHKTI